MSRLHGNLRSSPTGKTQGRYAPCKARRLLTAVLEVTDRGNPETADLFSLLEGQGPTELEKVASTIMLLLRPLDEGGVKVVWKLLSMEFRDLIEETTSPTTTYSSLGEDISQDIPPFSRPVGPARRAARDLAANKLEPDCRHLESRNQDNTRYFESQIVNRERDQTHTEPANQLHVEALAANKKLEADCRHLESRNQDNTRYFEDQLQAALAKINGLEADHKRLLDVQKQKNKEIQGLTAENEGFKGQLGIQKVELAEVEGIFFKRTHHSLTDDKASSRIKELRAISADFCSREDQKEFQLETEDLTKKSVEQQTHLQSAYHTINALEAKCENLLIQQGQELQRLRLENNDCLTQKEELEEVQNFSYSTVTEATDTFVDKACRKCEEVTAGQIREPEVQMQEELEQLRTENEFYMDMNTKTSEAVKSFSWTQSPLLKF
ncbi:hypothetical protein B0H14DRAFT_2611723 [Mycena olivaceomarginata]|nr:hypothetical protein B0H14DRAFT_2611723 [Mycena olivaceomarginata]